VSSVHAATQRRPLSPTVMHALPTPPHAVFELQRLHEFSTFA
jgi:hypothetical protein